MLGYIHTNNSVGKYTSYIDEFLKKGVGKYVFLYKIDRQATSQGDSMNDKKKSEVFFKDPVKIYCLAKISKKENKSYAEKGKGRYEEDGNLTIYLTEATAKKEGYNISYGDYIGYQLDGQMLYFNVVDNDAKNNSNEKTFLGNSRLWKIIECAPVNREEIMEID